MTFYGFAYLVMFALPMIGFSGLPRPPWWLRLAAISGFLMTALSVVLSIFPIIDVPNPMLFTLKVTGVILICAFIGAGVFLGYQRKVRLMPE